MFFFGSGSETFVEEKLEGLFGFDGGIDLYLEGFLPFGVKLFIGFGEEVIEVVVFHQ